MSPSPSRTTSVATTTSRPRMRHSAIRRLIAMLMAVAATLTVGGVQATTASAAPGTTFTNKTITNGLGSNIVDGVYATDDTIYAATDSGLSISTDGGATFTNKTTVGNGLGSNLVFGVYASGSTVYAATNGGLSISTDGGATFTNKTTTAGLGSNAVYGVYASGSTVYAATDGGGLSISTNGGTTFTNYTTTDGLGNNSVFGVYASGTTVYAATLVGLSIGSPGSPAAAPGVLTGMAAAPGNTTAAVSWTVDDTGGSAVTRIEFALDDTVTVDDSTTNATGPHTLTGLVNGQTYTIYTRAVNAVSAGPWSTGTPVTPQAPAPPTPSPVFPPGAPTSVTAVAGDAAATVTWAAPVDTGSFPVSTYQVTSSPEGRSCMTSTLTCQVSGLTNGTTYTFTVRPLNGAGWGPSSAPSAAVTPTAPPTPSIIITGSRTGRIIGVDGTTIDLTGTITPWIRFRGQTSFTEGSARPTITDNAFTWSRKANKKTYVYFTHEGVKSNTLTIAAR